MYTPCDDIGPDGLHHCPYGAMYASECEYYCSPEEPEDYPYEYYCSPEEPEDYPDLEDEDD